MSSGGPLAGAVADVADALWPRDAAAVAREWAEVQTRVEWVTSRASASAELEDLGVPERFTLGVFFAARWTLGLVGHRPLTGLESAVTPEAIRAEVGVAEYLLVSNAPTWDLAAGVRAWFAWLLGAKDVLAYPQPRV